MNFERDRTLTIMGTAGTEDREKIFDFNKAMFDSKMKGQPLFSKAILMGVRDKQLGSQLLSWTLACELKRTDLE